MAPNAETEAEGTTVEEVVNKMPINQKLAWRGVIFLSAVNIFGLYGLYLLPSCNSPWKMFFVSFALAEFGVLGIIAGAHRLWSHRSFKAKAPLRTFLMLGNCLAFQGTIYKWSRDHRVHHNFTDTDADPHSSKRGFFFCHMGWLMVEKHPEVVAKGQAIDCSDILADPVVRFQMKYYFPLSIFMCFIMPPTLTAWLFEDPLWKTFLVSGVARYCLSLHLTWLINSAAHMWGYRPYDKNISPRENPLMIMLRFGEGFHNFHHTFPKDYSSSELGMKWSMATVFIDLMASIGQAYDLKKVTPEMVKERKLKTGDHNHHHHH